MSIGQFEYDIIAVMTPKRPVIKPSYIPLPVTNVYFSELDEYEQERALSIEDLFTEAIESSGAMRALTKRQRKVARLMAAGYSRAEVAEKQGVGVQAVHQMVGVMRKRLRRYLETQRVV